MIYSVLVTFRVILFPLSHMRIFSRSALAPVAITSCKIHETACCGVRHGRLNMANKCLIHCANNIGAAEPPGRILCLKKSLEKKLLSNLGH
jgi:hypothetical protein